MDDDFALIDFALVAKDPATVALAIGAATRPAEDEAEPAERRGVFVRLLPRGGAAPGDQAPPLLIQPRSSLPPTPIVRPVLDDLGLAQTERLMRVSGPIQGTALTLIEFRADDSGRSDLCAGLSLVLRDTEIFYFRLSGARHPGAHYAFHVYQNGLASRRTAAVSEAGDHASTPWDCVDAGIFHPLETMGLPTGRNADAPVISPDRQSMILDGLGLDADTLFADLDARQTVLVLSPAEGGQPLTEAHSHGGVRLRGPATFVPGLTETPSDLAQAGLGGFSDDGPGQDAIRPPPSAAADVTQIDLFPEKPAWTAPPPAPSWDDEVMALLVDVVEHALPPSEQVPWLDQLTERLNGGEICEALAEAQVLIAYSDRSIPERLRLAARLANLFAPPEDDSAPLGKPVRGL